MGTVIEGFLTDNPMLMEQVISVLATIVTGLWARYKISEYRKGLQKTRYGKALEAIDAAVEETGREYVRDVKKKAADGKLSRIEINATRKFALNRAKQFAKEQGIDLIAELGRDFIDLHIFNAVQRQSD